MAVMTGEGDGMGVTMADRAETELDEEVSKAGKVIVDALSVETPLRDLVAVMAKNGFRPPAFREALAHLLYAGRVQLTEDRLLKLSD